MVSFGAADEIAPARPTEAALKIEVSPQCIIHEWIAEGLISAQPHLHIDRDDRPEDG